MFSDAADVICSLAWEPPHLITDCTTGLFKALLLSTPSYVYIWLSQNRYCFIAYLTTKVLYPKSCERITVLLLSLAGSFCTVTIITTLPQTGLRDLPRSHRQPQRDRALAWSHPSAMLRQEVWFTLLVMPQLTHTLSPHLATLCLYAFTPVLDCNFLGARHQVLSPLSSVGLAQLADSGPWTFN